MSKLEFHCIEYKKYGTSTITVGVSLKLENCVILQKEKTDYGYQKAVLKLSPEKVIKMKKIEEEVNEPFGRRMGVTPSKTRIWK